MVHIKFATFADGGFLRPVKREEKRNDFNMYGEVLVPKKPGSIHVKSVSWLLLGAHRSRSARMGPVKGP